MATNPYVNKVVYGSDTLIDLTSDTVDAAHLAQGYTAHDMSGALITGIMLGGRVSTYYTTCSTATNTAAKAITVPDWTPTAGDILAVLFTTANTAATPTLKINGAATNTSIYIGGSTPSSTGNVLKWSANTLILFIYDGTYFRYITARSAGSIVAPDGAGSWYATYSPTSTNETAAAKAVTCTNFRLTTGASITIQLSGSYGSTYTGGALTLNVNSTGAKNIYVNGAVTSATNQLVFPPLARLTFVYSGSYWYLVSTGHDETLYSDATGVNANSSFTLARSAKYYRWLDFIYTDGSRTYTERLYRPDGKATSLMRMVNSGTVQYVDSLMLSISGVTVTTGNGMQSLLDSGVFSDTNCHINIIEVRGGY